MPNPVMHFEITGKDGKALQEFYGKLFDWHVDANNPMNYGMVDTHDKGINGGISAGDGSGQQSYVTVYVEVDDTDAYLKKAEAAGGKTIMETTDIPGAVTMAMFTDPEGHVIGLIKAGSMQNG